eukprot:gene113-170_t
MGDHGAVSSRSLPAIATMIQSPDAVTVHEGAQRLRKLVTMRDTSPLQSFCVLSASDARLVEGVVPRLLGLLPPPGVLPARGSLQERLQNEATFALTTFKIPQCEFLVAHRATVVPALVHMMQCTEDLEVAFHGIMLIRVMLLQDSPAVLAVLRTTAYVPRLIELLRTFGLSGARPAKTACSGGDLLEETLHSIGGFAATTTENRDYVLAEGALFQLLAFVDQCRRAEAAGGGLLGGLLFGGPPRVDDGFDDEFDDEEFGEDYDDDDESTFVSTADPAFVAAVAALAQVCGGDPLPARQHVLTALPTLAVLMQHEDLSILQYTVQAVSQMSKGSLYRSEIRATNLLEYLVNAASLASTTTWLELISSALDAAHRVADDGDPKKRAERLVKAGVLPVLRSVLLSWPAMFRYACDCLEDVCQGTVAHVEKVVQADLLADVVGVVRSTADPAPTKERAVKILALMATAAAAAPRLRSRLLRLGADGALKHAQESPLLSCESKSCAAKARRKLAACR